jgi:hypothetical protein
VEIRSLIAAIPFLRKLWGWLPGPMKVVVVILAGVAAVIRLLAGEPESEAPTGENPTEEGA